MIINNMNLDELDRQEYIHFIKALIEYYYIQFSQKLELMEGEFS